MKNKIVGSALLIAAGIGIAMPVVSLAQAPPGGEYAAPPAAGPGGPGGRGGGRGRGPQEPPKPTPRLADGIVDLGGKGAWAPGWVLDWASARYVVQAVDIPFTPNGKKLYEERLATKSKDDPEGYCLPAGVPRYTGTPYPFQIIQLPDRVVIIYEGASHMYRVILLNAEHSKDPDPSWLGESVGHYEGKDTLVVDTIAFNGKTWLDYVGHPASDQLHVVERYTRPSLQQLHYDFTIEDPVNYTKPWSAAFNVRWQPGWEIKEYVCLENNKDLYHLDTKEPK